MKVRGASEKVWERLMGGQELVELVALMTWGLLLLYGGLSWYVRLPIALLSVGGILFKSLRCHPRMWFLAGITMLIGVFLNWESADNHKYLLAYWSLALYISFKSSDPKAKMALNGKLLIGCCFLFATIWKLRMGDFMDGTFFEYTFLADERFEALAKWVGGLEAGEIAENARLLSDLKSPAPQANEAYLLNSPALEKTALVMTWWTILIEGLIAVAFLLPTRPLALRLRNYCLILFVLSTYLMAPVIGFGWVLLIMALAQTDAKQASLRLLYITTFMLLILYQSPWKAVVDALNGTGG